MAKFYARRERMRGFGGRTAIAIAGTEEPRPAHEARRARMSIPGEFDQGIYIPGYQICTGCSGK